MENNIRKPVYVTEPFLPPQEEYNLLLKEIWERRYLTNQGPVVQELQKKLMKYLSVPRLAYVSNGTIALQLALSALDIDQGEIITTPFTYVATISSILWQRCRPVFVDINSEDFTIDVEKIEENITDETKAILAVHVFGIPCQVDKIQEIANKYGLKVIYDAAHAFGVRYKDKGICSYGDVSTLSFHSTKLFHTIEGGAVVVENQEVFNKLDLQMRFGHDGDNHYILGINGKNSEFHGAMGIVNLRYIDQIIAEREKISNYYTANLNNSIQIPKIPDGCQYNYAYYPLVLKDEGTMIKILEQLKKENIFPRRYFYPSLNNLVYVEYQSCPVSEDIASRIICLPLFLGLERKVQDIIIEVINKNSEEE